MTVRIHHIALTKANLDAIPQAERNLFVLLGHTVNEISVLSKLFHFCAGARSESPMLAQAENAQALVLGRLLTGKLFEFWMLLRAGYFRSGVSNAYHSLLDDEARAALDALRRYFGRDNLIARVRNKHAFHYEVREAEIGYGALVVGDPLDVYLSATNANTFYVFADTIIGRAMLERIKKDDAMGAFALLIKETSEVVGWVNTVVGALMSTCLKLHVGGDLYALGAKTIDIEGLVDSQKVSIPYFIEIDV